MLDGLVSDTLNPGFAILESSEVLKNEGQDGLIKFLDRRIGYFVVDLNRILKEPISDLERERAEIFLGRVKKYREIYPSTATDSPYYAQATKIINAFKQTDKKPASSINLQERLDQLRQMARETQL
ncbi:hypothetical protein OQJ68_16235 [Microbulbifer thermotolerans]|uniref:Uncharacterized protein n=1 Tax=Microbulbifer thermotolerans TaxID=252514 RepID=A0AB35I2N3_MICTH|nr:hypothetical protein [Microbulbifer thermotolerans]MCX2803329.1 hypothetical protein [Microbulbifer thermotolerans]